MSCGSVTPSDFRTLIAVSGVVGYEWFTDWMLCVGIDTITTVLKNKAVSGNFRSQLAVQFAPVRVDNPDAPGVFGSPQTGAGERCDDGIDVGTPGAAKMFMRIGVAYDLSTGSTPARADVGFQASFNACGRIVGTLNQQLVATSVTNSFIATGPFIPAISAVKLRYAGVGSSLTGDFQWRPTYRTAATSPDSPGAWATSFGSWVTSGDSNSGDLTPTLTGVMWVQPGVQFNLSNATPGQATVFALVAAKK